MDFEAPPFLKTGALNWTKNGFHYPSPPDIDLLSQKSLNSKNKWVVLASVIEFAKLGDFSKIIFLTDILNKNALLDRVGLVVIGSIGKQEHMDILIHAMRTGSNDARVHAAIGAARAGYIYLIPEMLTAWHAVNTVSDHEVIGYSISDLLESTPGNISKNAGSATLKIENPTAQQARLLALSQEDKSEIFEKNVFDALEKITKNCDKTSLVWGGNNFDIDLICMNMLSQLRSNLENFSGLIVFREKFEATTGINCSDFFLNGRLQKNRLFVILEKFLKSNDIINYEKNCRYFFGKKIPNLNENSIHEAP
jgi:hypothetical protein